MEQEKIQLIEGIESRGEKLLAANLQQGENVLVKLRGNFGQALVITDRHIYIPKWGFMTGNTFGGRCAVFSHATIVSIDIRKSIANNIFVVLTAATKDDRDLSYWKGGKENANQSDYAVTFPREKFELFQTAANMARDLIAKHHAGDSHPDNGLESLEKLAELRDKGVLTESEFVAKKKQMLGI